MRVPALIFASLVIAIFAAPDARGTELRLAISGYDPVAYFTDGRPVEGKPEFEHEWHRALWHFASAEHLALFAADPERYAPQYDGYCAVGVGWGDHKDTVDPQAWVIVKGRLYLAHDREWLDKWRAKIEENITQADAKWPAVKEQTVIYDGYPKVLKAN